jgi:hypothetical protein
MALVAVRLKPMEVLLSKISKRPLRGAKGDDKMPGISSKIALKYTKLFVDTNALHKIINDRGTMPADIRAIQKVIAAKLADRKLMEGLLNEYLRAGEMRVKL